MTVKEQYAKILPVIQAWVNGKNIQHRFPERVDNQWIDNYEDKPNFLASYVEWRIKPEPKYRPWTIDEVPVGGVVRHKEGSRYVITSASKIEGIRLGSFTPYFSLYDIFQNYTYLKDNDNTVLPCGVLEG